MTPAVDVADGEATAMALRQAAEWIVKVRDANGCRLDNPFPVGEPWGRPVTTASVRSPC
jgi:hypothetical protein